MNTTDFNICTRIINSNVKVSIDRPIGSKHPNHKGLIYPVNYGYVEDVLGGDGEWQDVYVLGISEPINAFEGIVIAVIYRHNDIETKWVVSLLLLILTRSDPI